MRLPSGTVTFLFTDIEGSTKLWEQYPGEMRTALAHHDTLLRETMQAHNGYVFKTVGDAFCAAFSSATEGLAAVLAVQQALHAVNWDDKIGTLRVRMALHTGAAEERDGDYFGQTLNRVARLLAIGHGGQVLLSEATTTLIHNRLPDGCGLRDMSLHRLKDLQQPEHVWQLLYPDLPSDFPPLRSLQAFTNNLPVQSTSFIGRESEMEEVKRLLDTTHLLTLTGAGGCGKTRLALQVAVELLEAYSDGVWLVELAVLTDPTLVAQTIATALELREEANRPLVQTLTDYLKPKTLLLILDNCEHLVETCAQLADTLLRSCPRIKLLVTSREALNIAGETTYRIPSLVQPDPKALPIAGKELVSVLAEYDAVRLFVERARAHRSDFALHRQNGPAVAEVCSRLDGIPLAIELAAARVKVLTAEQIAARLDDRFKLLTGGNRTALPRQQTLRALIDWSYDLLSEQEQVLLRRLSVFTGGWTLESAEQVCAGKDIEAWQVLDALTALVDKSLVIFEERAEGAGRYRLLETIRQYSLERLSDTEEETLLRNRHRDFFLALAERAEPQLIGPEEGTWLARLEAEHENLRVVLERCRTVEDSAEAGLRLAAALWRFWDVRGYFSEGRREMEDFLGRCGEAPASLRARSHNITGMLSDMQGDYGSARHHYGQSVALWQEASDELRMSAALNNLAVTARKEGSLQEARATHERALAIRRKLGRKSYIAASLGNLGIVMRDLGDYETARTLLEESLQMNRELEERSVLAHMIGYLGTIAWHQGDYAKARLCFAEGLTSSVDLNYRLGIMQHLEGFARIAAVQAQPIKAARLWGAAEVLSQAIEAPIPASERAEYERNIAIVRTALGEEAFAAAWTEGRAMTVEQAITYALSEE
jgi:predicted ATPase/class 3 adenylate cyclase